MRRLIAALLIAATLTVGAVATPAPVDASPISLAETNNICVYIRPYASSGPIWAIANIRNLHYGTAHVHECWYTRNGLTRCRRYVNNIPAPWWTEYPAGYGVWCW